MLDNLGRSGTISLLRVTSRMEKPWYLYLLECKNGRLYSGVTTDLAARFNKHKRGKGGMFTRLNPPRRIVAAMMFENRAEASKAEYRMKQLSAAQKLRIASGWAAVGDLPGDNENG
jgi:putative endonuclease